MSEKDKDKVKFEISQHLFEQLSEWQDKMEAADRLADESEKREPTITETHPDIYESPSKTDNS
ncbi:hypothetical protein PN499_16450 [Kamptonema animale CS-326]|jgi:hypothetical protein|uniref:hypothetical protein n=1 Tax=Kamptonema animale TaxID=92934 RepID=UPI00232E0E55|nr:hypothetical protein [Kamptonema animale]MDB9512780.1 hypothetical protein [Kamptonema animale CS-326]